MRKIISGNMREKGRPRHERNVWRPRNVLKASVSSRMSFGLLLPRFAQEPGFPGICMLAGDGLAAAPAF